MSARYFMSHLIRFDSVRRRVNRFEHQVDVPQFRERDELSRDFKRGVTGTLLVLRNHRLRYAQRDAEFGLGDGKAFSNIWDVVHAQILELLLLKVKRTSNCIVKQILATLLIIVTWLL